MLRTVTIHDAAAICEIYNYYVTHSVATFEEKPISVPEGENRIREIISTYPWFVWEEEGIVRGFSYLHQFHTRCAYRFTVEDTVYVYPGFEGKAIGTALLGAVLETIEELEKREKRTVHAVIAAITLPNERSKKLHEHFSFKHVGHFKEVGYKMGQWLDVGYWELIRDRI
ncbi:MAG: GNAT family N-acetyltransferase [Treponema sp.]|jgi:phosphinothricin acetyltransferase|nr:GNAT family N-acetyltransferase [Treponema sp.]